MFLNINFKLEILAKFEFLGNQIHQQTVHETDKFHSHFQLKSKREGRNNKFYRAMSLEISEELSANKIS